MMTNIRRSRWLDPRQWSLVVQFNLVMLFVLGVALLVTTAVIGRTTRTALSRQIGVNMQAQAGSVSDTIHHFFLERVGQLQVLSLSNHIALGVAEHNRHYPTDLTAVVAEIEALDMHWRTAAPDDELVAVTISPDPLVNPVASELYFFLAALPEHTELIVTDRYGATVAATGRLTDYAQGDEFWWQAAWHQGEGAIFLSAPVFDESAGIEAVLIAAPIYDTNTGEVIGVIRSTLRADHLLNLVARQTFGETGRAELISTRGNLSASTDAGGSDASLTATVLEKITTSGMATGYFPFTDSAGGELLVAYAPVPRVDTRSETFLERATGDALAQLGLVILVEQDAAEAMGSVDQIAWTSGFVGGLMLLLALSLGLALTRAVTQPLVELTDAVETFGLEQAPAAPLVTSNDETGRLADSFTRLGTRLRQTVGDLEVQIQELERAEAALRASENRYRLLFDTLPVAIYTKDLAGAYTSANDNMRALRGPDLVGQSDQALLPAAAAAEVQAVDERVVATGESVVIEQAIPGPVGEQYLLTRVGPLRDADNQIIGVLGASIDITTRKLLEQTLMESVAHRARQVETSTAVAQQIAAAPVMAELFERVVTLVQQQFGYYHAQVYTLDAPAPDADPAEPRYLVLQAGTGATSKQLIAAGHRIPLVTRRSLVARAAQTGRPVIVPDVTREPAWLPNILLPETRAEITVPIKLGEQVLGVLDVQNSVVNSLGAEDELLLSGLCGQIAVAIDYRRAEQALQLYSNELEAMVEARTAQLRAAQADLVRQERLAILGKLAAGVGHELRNPLGVVTNAIFLLQMMLSSHDESQEYLDIISGRIEAMEQIIGGLVDYATTAPLAPNFISVAVLIEQALKQVPLPETVAVDVAVPADLADVFVDDRQIIQALANLLANAWQAQADPLRIRIEAAPESPFVQIVVADSGPGIAVDAQAQIFEPLFSTKVHGIGLGLPAARNLVEINGGQLSLTSAPAEGTTVTILLPTRPLLHDAAAAMTHHTHE